MSALNHQRHLLGQLAGIENTLAMLKRNIRLLELIHFGIDELTSRAYESYSSIEAELTDRHVRSLRV